MKLVKVFAVIIVALAIIGALVWQLGAKDQVAFARIATAYGAKMTCSCRFVAGRDMDTCMGDFTADMSPVSFTETADSIRTSAAFGLASSEARFEPGLGCTLVE